MSKLIGIDLGTTNSCVAVMEGGVSTVIPCENGNRTMPSIVAFTQGGVRLVGGPAKRQAVANPDRTISSIKRHMGSGYKVNIDGRAYTPQEISAMILGKLKEYAEDYIGETVTDAVITVPAYFTDSQRQATKDAGAIAGLNVKRIVNEPTAAALAYGLDREEPQKIMVYDLGGGTFDVSVLSINAGVIEVLATAGNNHLGGDDFDEILTDYIVSEFKKKEKINLSKDSSAMQRIREAAEQAKIDLSSSTSANISLPFIYNDRGTGKHISMTITREQFDNMTSRLVKSTEGPVRQALKDAKLSAGDLSKVLMVGGSSRIPAVCKLVESITGKVPFKGINPDECVAMGAAIQSGVLAGTVGGLLLLDVTPLSLGIETLGDNFSKIIERNTTIPITKSQVFSTAYPYQSSVTVHVLQGERERASGNKTIGKFNLTGIRRAPAGVPQIEVTFDIDANGIVHVSARDLDTGKMQDITISGSGNLSRDEICNAINDAKKYAAEDSHKRRVEDAQLKANSLISRAKQVEKADKKNKAVIAEPLKRVKKASNGKDICELESANAELENILNNLQS